jgi:predicted NBD/HSP70 family sugar kinase
MVTCEFCLEAHASEEALKRHLAAAHAEAGGEAFERTREAALRILGYTFGTGAPIRERGFDRGDRVD